MSANNTTIQYTLALVIDDLQDSARKLEGTFVRLLNYAEKIPQLRDNESLLKFINNVEHAIVTIRSFQIAITAFEMASGPVGWLFAGTSALAAAFSLYDFQRGMS